MGWLKNVIVDILVTIFIAAAFWLSDTWMWWVIVVYTVVLLIAKSISVTSEGFISKTQKKQQAPEWFLHLLYGVNVLLLALAGWWFLAAGWVAIWILSYLGQRKSKNN